MSGPADSSKKPGFDAYAGDYDAALAQGLSASGESKDYFTEGRVDWLTGRLGELYERPASILDFGCGTGTNIPFLLKLDGVTSVLGVDVSESSLDVARRDIPDSRAAFSVLDRYQPDGRYDLIFTNGVFHHIPPAERAGAIDYIYRALRPGGLLAFWENNPWNPGTRYVMSRIPFDRDAITLSAPEAQGMIRAGGFDVLRTDFLFIFPKMLGWLRGLEPRLAKLPFGAQYTGVLPEARSERPWVGYNTVMKIIGCITLLLVIFVLLSVPAFATDLTVFGGMQHEGKISLNSVSGSGGTAVQILKNPFNSGVFGIRVSSGKVFGHEETLAYAPNFIDSNSKAVILNSNFLVSIPAPVVKPYVTAGIGTFVVSGSGPSDIGTKFAINYGGGVKLMPAGPIGLRGDVRGYSLTSIQGHKLNTVEVSLGVVFKF